MPRFLIFFLLFVTVAMAMESKGFQGVAFGLSKDKVVEEIFRQGYTPEEQGNQVTIPIYKLGELPVEVVFRFNRAGHFFSYELRTGTVERDRFPKVVEAVRYMSEQLSEKFGQPQRKNFYRLEEINGKRAAPYWVWEDPEIDMVTFIKTRDARFFTQATVTHKILAREK